jgi:hypothetical protein
MDLKNSFLFPAVQSMHLIGIAVLVGTIVLVDLEVLGFGIRRRAAPLGRWMWTGFAVISITGPILFLADTVRYLSNPAFLLKMVFLTAALALHFTIHRRPTKPAAVLSIILWTCVVIGGRAIADFDV